MIASALAGAACGKRSALPPHDGAVLPGADGAVGGGKDAGVPIEAGTTADGDTDAGAPITAPPRMEGTAPSVTRTGDRPQPELHAGDRRPRSARTAAAPVELRVCQHGSRRARPFAAGERAAARGRSGDGAATLTALTDAFHGIAHDFALASTKDAASANAFSRCDAGALGEATCAQRFIAAFIPRLFRRPLDAEDTADFAGGVREGTGARRQLRERRAGRHRGRAAIAGAPVHGRIRRGAGAASGGPRAPAPARNGGAPVVSPLGFGAGRRADRSRGPGSAEDEGPDRRAGAPPARRSARARRHARLLHATVARR